MFMEDYDFISTIKSLRIPNSIKILPHDALTSSRRYYKNGIFYNTFLNQVCTLKYIDRYTTSILYMASLFSVMCWLPLFVIDMLYCYLLSTKT
jgi:hypothetical protein